MNTAGGSVAFNAFSSRGIRVRIDQSWFIAFFLFACTLSVVYFPFQVPNYSAFTYWVFGTLSSLGLFGCVLLHELSHCVVAQHLGVPVRQITLFIFGGVSEMDQTHSSSPAVEFKTSIAGPLASFGLSALFWTLAMLTRTHVERIVLETFHYLYYVNFVLGIFNLIPGFPLDGGRVLRSFLWVRSGDLRNATRQASGVGRFVANLMMAIGLVIILMTHVVPGAWLMLIGLFLRRSAANEYESFETRLGLQNMKLRDIMVPAIAVDNSISISELVNEYVFHYHYRAFPVLKHGRFIGMIDVRSIKGVPTAAWPTTKIAGYLSDARDYCVLDPETDANDALHILMSRNCSKAPVVSNGVLLGILTRSDLHKLVALRRDIAA
jgi:Zn-dependent protease/predicted transcriptional regulator